MKELINQAFSHIGNIGPHVRAGHYDLEGPEGELILKEIWDTTIQPGWQITMKMWPDLDLHPLRDGHAGAAAAAGLHHRGGPNNPVQIPQHIPPEHRAMWASQFAARRAQANRAQQPPPGTARMPPMAGVPQRPPVPPTGATFPMFPGVRGAHQVPAEVQIVEGERKPHKKSSHKTKKAALGWLTGSSGNGSKKK